MEKQPWGPGTVKRIAGEVRRHRKARGLSTQQLADACAALGFPIKRTVLSNLESGYRETVTVPELLVLAEALSIPPLLLLFPLGHEARIEALPGRERDIWQVVQWFIGENRLPDAPTEADERWEEAAAVVALFREHHAAMQRRSQANWRANLAFRQMENAADDTERARIEHQRREAEEQVRQAEGALWTIRSEMRERKLIPPDLPAELEHVDTDPLARAIESHYSRPARPWRPDQEGER